VLATPAARCSGALRRDPPRSGGGLRTEGKKRHQAEKKVDPPEGWEPVQKIKGDVVHCPPVEPPSC